MVKNKLTQSVDRRYILNAQHNNSPTRLRRAFIYSFGEILTVNIPAIVVAL